VAVANSARKDLFQLVVFRDQKELLRKIAEAIDGLVVERANTLRAATAFHWCASVGLQNPPQHHQFKISVAPDNIVGKMTIAALDRELLTKKSVQPYTQHYWGSDARRSTPILYNVRSTGSLQNASFSSTSSSVTLTPATTILFGHRGQISGSWSA
jgi:hypothetical protein